VTARCGAGFDGRSELMLILVDAGKDRRALPDREVTRKLPPSTGMVWQFGT
jgi:hypothetical protein